MRMGLVCAARKGGVCVVYSGTFDIPKNDAISRSMLKLVLMLLLLHVIWHSASECLSHSHIRHVKLDDKNLGNRDGYNLHD
jgi:hypothetical protein